MIRILDALVQRPIAARTSRARQPRSFVLPCGVLLLGLARPGQAQSQLEERAPERYFPAVPDTTFDLVAADFDGDGDPDVLTANGFQPARLYRSDGDGFFTDVTETSLPPVRSLHRRIGVGDIDGDGDLDVLLTSGRSANAGPALLVNDGTGSFVDETAARLPAGSLRNASRPLFGDVDGDADLDLVVPSQGGTASLFLNDGLGLFTDVSAGRMPSSTSVNKDAALADVDGDLDLDLVLVNNSQDRLYLNDGLGFFTDVTATNMPVEQGFNTSGSLALIDVDLDLDLDMVVGDGGSGGANALRLNDGLGVFSDASFNLPVQTSSDQANSIAVGDVDGDLDLDIVLGNLFQSRLLLGDGAGAFVDAPFPARPFDTFDNVGGLALVDVDDDSDLDLVMGRTGSERLYLNDGAGGFTNVSEARVPWGLLQGTAVALADLDLDGDQDLALANGAFMSIGYGEIRTYLNDGTGTFPTGGRHFTRNTTALAAGDVDGDADVDLLAGAASLCSLGYGCFPNGNVLLLNDGEGGFTQIPGNLPPDGDDTFAVALADVDGDGDLDAVAGNWLQQSRLYRNAGDGSFTDVTAGRLPARADAARALGVGDFDGDGDLDLVLGNEAQQSRMYVNEGLGAFFDGTATRMPPLARATRALGVADLDGDGDLDLVLGNDGRAGLYLNNGAGKLLDYTDRMPQQVEATWALVLGDLDEDGDLDVVLGNRSPSGGEGQNRLLLNDGSARFTDSGRLPADLDHTAALALGDVDGDRDLDLVTGNLQPGSVRAFGANRLYLNLHRQLDARSLPLLGRTYEIEVDAQPGYASVPHEAYVVFATALLPAPIPVPPVVGELALVPDFFFWTSATIPSPLGSQVIDLAVPTTPALAGETFYAQALILGGGPAHLTGWLQDTFGF